MYLSDPDLSIQSMELIVPIPRVSISIRQATLADVPFIDGLQKKHRKMLGFMSFAQLKGYIEGGHVLVAESSSCAQSGLVAEGGSDEPRPSGSGPLPHGCGSLGYIIAKDRYFKRDDVGVIFQLNVTPGAHRQLVGASLVQAVFERAAYGCKLFCCWCAQDIEANYFWESIGFVPLAFRTGGRGRTSKKTGQRPAPPQARIHIFWQRRINQEEEALTAAARNTQHAALQTPYWYPSHTGAGAIREDRIVLPIPPGTHWSDAKPLVLPGLPASEEDRRDACPTVLPGSGRERAVEGVSPLPAAMQPHPREEKKGRKDRGARVGNPCHRGNPCDRGSACNQSITSAAEASRVRCQSKHLRGCPPGKVAIITGSGIRYVDRVGPRNVAAAERDEVEAAEKVEVVEAGRQTKAAKARPPKQKFDAKYIAMARELRDRYLEEVNSGRLLPMAEAKYEVGRTLELRMAGGTPAPPKYDVARQLEGATEMSGVGRSLDESARCSPPLLLTARAA